MEREGFSRRKRESESTITSRLKRGRIVDLN